MMWKVDTVQDKNLLELWLVENDELKLRQWNWVSVKYFVVDSTVQKFEFLNFDYFLVQYDVMVLIAQVLQYILNIDIGIDCL